ncbi:MAG: sigma-70 family RNA polymerase sigma factor [Ruminococcus sp.]|nr:sigma-70 family RNA polymerase sigma factor [Ruminococcus sp.]
MTDFDGLYREQQSAVYRFLFKLSGSAHLSEELTQETFYRAYINLPSLRDESKARIWLCQIAKNCYNAYCNEKKKQVPLENTAEPEAPDIADSFAEKELSKKAFSKLHELEEPYKEVFMLSVFANLSLKEISELFGKSESWARVTFFRAKKKLIEKLR